MENDEERGPRLIIDNGGGNSGDGRLQWEQDGGEHIAAICDGSGQTLTMMRIQRSSADGRWCAGTWTLLCGDFEELDEIKAQCQLFVDRNHGRWWPTIGEMSPRR